MKRMMKKGQRKRQKNTTYREKDLFGHCRRCVWTPEEDCMIRSLVIEKKSWIEVAKEVSKLQPRKTAKTVKQCRERWNNCLNPSILNCPWTEEEKEKFFFLFPDIGPKWAEISKYFPGRSYFQVRNYFYCRTRKLARRVKQGKISADMKSCPQEIQHNLFLLKYLNKKYLSTKNSCEDGLVDKYIKAMVKNGSLTREKVTQYKKEYIASVTNFSQSLKASNTEESFTVNQRILPSLIDCAFSSEPGQSHEARTGSQDSINSLHQTFSLLLEMNLSQPTKHNLALPLPASFFPGIHNPDEFVPDFRFYPHLNIMKMNYPEQCSILIRVNYRCSQRTT